jgi:isocitrate/isopropylmalate dehydrogenase
LDEAARNIEKAITAALATGLRTPDIYTGSPNEARATTAEMAAAIQKHLQPNIQQETPL